MAKYLFILILTCSLNYLLAGNFTPGNIVVVRVGDGSAALSSAAQAVFLDEYTVAGTLVQSIALPIAANGNNHALTLSGSANSEGALALSANNQYLTLAGYDAAPGLASVASDTNTNRTIAILGANGIPNTSTGFVVGSAYKKNNIRGAVSNDGTSFWASGNGSGTSGGVWYLPSGSFTSSPVQISTTVTNTRAISIFNSQLYASSGTTSYLGVNAAGTGLPTTSGQTITDLPGSDTTSSPYGFYFFDENNNIPGVDVLYICDDRTTAPAGGLYKFSLVGGNWVSNGNITNANGLRGIAANQNCKGVQLYVSDENAIYSLQDTTGYNGALTGSLTAIANAGTNTIFHGVSFAPGTTASTGVQASVSASTNVTCAGYANGSVTVTVSGSSTYTYAWSDGNVTTQNRNNLAPGNYTVTVTGSGCTATATATIGQPQTLRVTSAIVNNVSCNGGNNGSVTLQVTGGTSPYTFSPSTLTALSSGDYDITVTDKNSCSTTFLTHVNQPAAIAITDTVTNLPCTGGGNTGAVNIGVTGGNSGGYTYAWSNNSTTQNISGLAANTYIVTVTDTAHCSATLTAIVSHSGSLVVTPAVSEVTCYGLSNGAITLTPSGGTAPYNYSWNNSDTGHAVTGLAAGSYVVTINDNGGCTLISSIPVTQPALLTATLTTVNVSCFGAENGSINIVGAGGTGAYTYSGNAQGLAPGVYSVSVADSNHCRVTLSDTIQQPDSLALTLTVTNVSVSGGSDGSIDLTTTGGTGTYTYDWTNGNAGRNDSNLVVGTYCVKVTDQHSCVDSACATVTLATGIARNEWLQTMTAYSNGNSLVIDIVLGNEMRCNVQLFDITGSMITSNQPVTASQFHLQWPEAGIAPGCYVIRVATDAGVISRKIIVTR